MGYSHWVILTAVFVVCAETSFWLRRALSMRRQSAINIVTSLVYSERVVGYVLENYFFIEIFYSYCFMFSVCENFWKRVVLPSEKKIEIIEKFQKGHTVKAITVEYNVQEATVHGIIKQKEHLLKFACSSDSSPSMKKQKTLKKSTYDDLDKALLEWFNKQRALGNPVNGPICAVKAKEVFTSLGLQGPFDASSGWLSRFKSRHGIRELDIQGEKLSSNEDAATEFTINFNK